MSTNKPQNTKYKTISIAAVLAIWMTTSPVSALPTAAIKPLSSTPTIDGYIDEDEWSGARTIDQPFIQFQPDFGKASSYRTVVKLGQTMEALYVAFIAFDPDPSRLAAAISLRDGDLKTDDSVTIALDSFGDKRTAYLFRTNALSTQGDGRIADNGRTLDMSWDAAWKSSARRYNDRWIVEFEIPFSILRYSSESDATWGINFSRTVPRRLETSLWADPGEDIWRVTSFGALKDIKLPVRAIKEWELIPYIMGSFKEGKDTDFEIGADIRWRPSNSFGVDLTINPDFALVEADVEEINLTRFELQIAEKRPFFLEGNEMFNQRIRQFYSRRIGDMEWGAKSNGKFGNTDFSVIAATEDMLTENETGEQTAEYTVLRFQQSLNHGSNIGLLASNRYFQGENAGTVGVDTPLFFTDTFGMTGQIVKVHGPNSDGDLSWFLRPAYDSSTTHFHVRLQELGDSILEDFNAVGFLIDDNRREFDTNFSHIFWIKNGIVDRIQPEINYNRYTSQQGVLRSWEWEADFELSLRNGWEFEIEFIDEFKLFEKEFYNDRITYEIGWDGRDGRSVFTYFGSGYNFDNDITLYGLEVNWPLSERWQFSYDISRLKLDPDIENESTWIRVLETRYSFTPDLFLKLFVQTNSAINKENVQLLGVWRFKPPFGSLQVAYQRGNPELGQISEEGDNLFLKFAWPF